jgi:hypothetical protein
MKINNISRFLVAGAAVVSSLAVALVPLANQAYAAGQVTTRSIQMSSSHISDTASYVVTFTPQTTGAQSLVMNFCQESPIPGATCTTPTGFSAASAGFTAGTGFTNWVTGTMGAGQFEINKGGTGSNLATSAVSFTITNVTNPSSTGAFYARIYTYNNTSYNGYTNSLLIGTPMDTGGFALSIVNYINVQATVQETLTFCVSKAAPGSACSGTTSANLIIGNGGTPNVLDAAAVYSDTAYTQVTSNASTGVVVAMKTAYSCNGLSKDGGSTCPITGIGSFANLGAGSGKFGLSVADGTGGTGSVSHDTDYGTTAGSYGMGAGVTSTYGDPIESSSGPTTNVNSQLTFAASAAASTTAGVYQTNEMLIATGTF